MGAWHILGAGAIGSLITHRMLQSQCTCTLLHHHNGVSSRSLIDGENTVELPVQPLQSLASKSIDRLLLTTKAGQLIDALRLASPFLSQHAVIACTANGLGFEDAFSQVLPGHSLYRAVSTAAAFRDHKAAVHIVANGMTRIGAPDTAAVAPYWFEDSLALLPGWRWESPLTTAIGEKFAINCVINPLTATLECRNGELLSHGGAGPELQALCQESEPALRRLGLWSRESPLLDAAVSVCGSTAQNQSSMLQDKLAGRATEINFLNGELLRRARPLGLELPINQTLVKALG
ncbi:2-dehydropantoate 2-reductase [gamma proteobacterium NOR5-3]|nr:2-dehydropantoate 2-reductase [gamma proteobacterium NOR5-3]